MSWVLPDADRVLPGLHPPEMGRPFALFPDSDVAVLGRIEPLLRRMSVVADTERPSKVASRLLALFVQVVELVVPTLLPSDERGRVVGIWAQRLRTRRLTRPARPHRRSRPMRGSRRSRLARSVIRPRPFCTPRSRIARM